MEMESWNPQFKYNEKLVDAIEEGKIVRVTERYARLEGLPILRKSKIETKQLTIESQKLHIKNNQKPVLSLDDLRKPLRTKDNQVLSELIDNFHWEISKKRRQLSLTRKQLANKINVSEEDLKLIENGILPTRDFVIINKIQNYLQINLRKDQKDFTQSPRSLLKEKEEEKLKQEKNQIKSEQQKEDEIIGEEIEIVDE